MAIRADSTVFRKRAAASIPVAINAGDHHRGSPVQPSLDPVALARETLDVIDQYPYDDIPRAKAAALCDAILDQYAEIERLRALQDEIAGLNVTHAICDDAMLVARASGGNDDKA